MDALLVGGPEDIRFDMERNLAEIGIRIRAHWPYRHENRDAGRPIPNTVQLVIFLTDMASHSSQDLVVKKAKKRRIPVVRCTRKRSSLINNAVLESLREG